MSDKEILNAIAKQVAVNSKDVLTLEEASIYTGLSKSQLYKHTCNMVIPHYKPSGKMVYFERKELNAWMLQNRCSTGAELNDKAQAYCQRKEK